MADFLHKRLTQTEYRGSRYKASQDKGSQYLDLTIPSSFIVPAAVKTAFRLLIVKHVRFFLEKLVAPEHVESVLDQKWLETLYKKMDT